MTFVSKTSFFGAAVRHHNNVNNPLLHAKSVAVLSQIFLQQFNITIPVALFLKPNVESASDSRSHGFVEETTAARKKGKTSSSSPTATTNGGSQWCLAWDMDRYNLSWLILHEMARQEGFLLCHSSCCAPECPRKHCHTFLQGEAKQQFGAWFQSCKRD